MRDIELSKIGRGRQELGSASSHATISSCRSSTATRSAFTSRSPSAAPSAPIATLPRASIRPANTTRYVDRLIEDMRRAADGRSAMGVELPRRVDTVYLGGGTPSLLAPELLARLFAAIRAEFELDPDAEITVECAPGQLADETLAALVAAGVNRVSLGVQSFIDREAAVSGRLHNRAVVLEDVQPVARRGNSQSES